ncbi:MAG: hypothetical protein U1D97_06830 [Desulfuromonadales bacterium]|nr:hypothetical protein [Desulfuromonadales bacterium]
MSTLTLIGTVHHDPRSAARLAALLAQLQPDRITVEISPDVVLYRQTHGVLLLRKLGMIVERLAGAPASTPRLAEHPDIKTIRTLLGLPYEFRVACTYARKRGIQVQAIDQADSSLAKLRPVEERLVSMRHLKKIISSPKGAPADNAHRYVLARQLLATPDAQLLSDFLQGCRGEEGIGPRDRHLSEKIRSLVQSQPGHLVHIGGWVHLLDDPAGETLYSLLADLQPRRILLDPDYSPQP